MSPGQLIFSIQPGHPEVVPVDRAPDLAGAVQAIFPMDTDDAILNWNRVPVRLGYRYDVSVLIDDVLPLLGAIAGDARGEYEVGWGSDTFNATWHVRWDGEGLSVHAHWHSVSGDYEDLLNERPTIAPGREAFTAEWAGLLRTVADGVERSGVQLERTVERDQLRDLLARP